MARGIPRRLLTGHGSKPTRGSRLGRERQFKRQEESSAPPGSNGLPGLPPTRDTQLTPRSCDHGASSIAIRGFGVRESRDGFLALPVLGGAVVEGDSPSGVVG